MSSDMSSISVAPRRSFIPIIAGCVAIGTLGLWVADSGLGPNDGEKAQRTQRDVRQLEDLLRWSWKGQREDDWKLFIRGLRVEVYDAIVEQSSGLGYASPEEFFGQMTASLPLDMKRMANAVCSTESGFNSDASAYSGACYFTSGYVVHSDMMGRRVKDVGRRIPVSVTFSKGGDSDGSWGISSFVVSLPKGRYSFSADGVEFPGMPRSEPQAVTTPSDNAEAGGGEDGQNESGAERK